METSEKSTKTFDPNAAAAPDSGIFGLDCSPEDAAVVLIPVPFEATTSFGGGTSKGPAAILEASKQVDLFDRALGNFWKRGIHMLTIPKRIEWLSAKAKEHARAIIERGGIGCAPELHKGLQEVNSASEAVNTRVHGLALELFNDDKLVGVIGGDHSVPFGAIKACAEKHGEIGILHIDAHADLREAFEGFTWSHASIMRNVARLVPGVKQLVQIGVRDYCEDEWRYIQDASHEVHTIFDDELLRGERWGEECFRRIADLPKKVYVSFDVDGLDPSLCPHTGTPVPGGLQFNEAVNLFRWLRESAHTIVGFDVCETGNDPWDANVAARILYKLIGYALLPL